MDVKRSFACTPVLFSLAHAPAVATATPPKGETRATAPAILRRVSPWNADESPPCLTPLLIDLYRNRVHLPQEAREALETAASGTTRPPSSGSVASTHYPIRVHYPSEDYRARAEEILAYAEQSWEIEVNDLGFAAPLPDQGAGGDDSLDIYLASYDLTAGGGYTQPSYWDADPSDGRQACSSHILLYQDLDPSVLPVYVAHEFNHATQCAMDFQEITWAWETTATFIEDVVYDDIDDYYRYIPDFQAYPEQTLVYFDTLPPYALYPYGATIFIHFLDEALGRSSGRVAARLWIDSEQPGIDNEPDFLDAVQALALENGWNGLDQAYGTFALWRYFVSTNDDGAHFEEGAAWNATASGQGSIPPVRLEETSEALPVTGDLTDVCPLGTSYVLLNMARHGQTLILSAETTADTRIGMAASRISDAPPSEDVILTPEAPGQSLSAVFDAGSADRVLIAFLNLGAHGYDPDTATAPNACIPIHYTIDLDRGGCSGCTTRPDGRNHAPTVLLAMLLTIVRAGRRRRGRPGPS